MSKTNHNLYYQIQRMRKSRENAKMKEEFISMRKDEDIYIMKKIIIIQATGLAMFVIAYITNFIS